jgi:hypothetical protein
MRAVWLRLAPLVIIVLGLCPKLIGETLASDVLIHSDPQDELLECNRFYQVGIPPISSRRIYDHWIKLVSLGPRVSGSATLLQARNYLRAEYEAAGYVTYLQDFQYPNIIQEEASVSWLSGHISGHALTHSGEGKVTGAIALIPGVGTVDDVAHVDVSGRIAVVRRGDITFSEKVNHVMDAGAIALIIVNNVPGSFDGRLLDPVPIPVLSVSEAEGMALIRARSPQR